MELPKRKQSRLNEYDYTQEGYYFITICTKDRKNLFWNTNVVSNASGSNEILSMYGNTLLTALNNIPIIYGNLELNKYVIMPNHVHMILVIKKTAGD